MSNRIEFFDIWQAGYAGATVHVYEAGTTTLADLFYDEALTEASANPQSLLSLSQNGMSFGKFARAIYTAGGYSLVINSTDQTGVIQPSITTLDGEDASLATVRAASGTVDRRLEDFLDFAVQVENHGEFLPTSNVNASSTTNTTTLAAAVGVVAAAGGGYVEIPKGTYLINTLTVSPGVILRGRGEDVTVLQSSQGSAVLTAGGDLCGCEDITLDGVSNQANSIGFYSKANDSIRMRRAKFKRFATGLHFRGGRRADFEDLSVDACATGCKWHGDNDASGGANGDEFRYNRWEGGRVTACTTIGVDIAYVDKKCYHNTVAAVNFENNTGIAVQVNGARWTEIGDRCSFDGNTTNLNVLDGTDTSLDYENTVVGLHIDGGLIDDGAMAFTGKCQDIVFDRVEFNGGTYTMTTVTNNIVVRDCTEAAAVTLAGGDATKWTRQRSTNDDFPGSAGVTTDNVATEAWSYKLAPGEVIHIEAVVIANGRNSEDHAIYHIARSAERPGSTLAYDAQTANFTLGATLTGGTSGATARIVADADGGATGTLTLRDIVGAFVDNEALTDSSAGAAVANGTLVAQNAALLGATTSLETAVETVAGYDCDFGASVDKIRIMVTGDTGDTLEWTVSAKVTSSG